MKNTFSGILIAVLLTSTFLLELDISQITPNLNCTIGKPSILKTLSSAIPKDILVVNDPCKQAFFGWFQASNMPFTGWDLLNRTIRWAAGDLLRNETRIVFFSNTPLDADATAVHTWLVNAGYDELMIEQHNCSDAETLLPVYYDDFDLAIYWNRTASDSTNIISSEIPFITVSAGQTDEMGIGSGITTLHGSNDTFHVVNVNYYPTLTYPKGPTVFENALEFETTEAVDGGRVLIKAEVESASPSVELMNWQSIAVQPDGGAEMSFSIYAANSSLADIYREYFFLNASSLEPGVEYEIPENKTIEILVNLEEGAMDVSLPGDIDGNGKTDIFDIVRAAGAYGTYLGEEQWVLEADVNWDGKVDIFDIVGMAVHYGKTRENTGELCVVGYYNGSVVDCTEVFYIGPQGGSNPINVSASGYTWFGLSPGVYNVYGTHNGNQTSITCEVTEGITHGQLDFGGTEKPPPPTPYVSVRDNYCQAIEDEQLALLGFDINITESKVTPWTSGDGVIVSLAAYAPQIVEFVSFWRIPVGPHNMLGLNRSANFMFWKVQFTQMMLQKISGEQVYDGSWEIEVSLPPTASLLNGGELHGLNWTIDFGGGTFMEANVTLDTTSIDPKISVLERMVVTEQNITISEGDFSDAIAQYRIFNIDYTQIGQFNCEPPMQVRGIDWQGITFVEDLWFTVPLGSYSDSWEYGSFSGGVYVNPQLTLKWRISGRFNFWLRCLKRLGTWITVWPSVKTRAWGTVAGEGSKTFGPHTIFSVDLTRFPVAIGPLPCWFTLTLSSLGKVKVQASANYSLQAEAFAGGWWKTGVHWRLDEGFDPTFDHEFIVDGDLEGSLDSANFTLTPSASLRLALLLYDIAGPFVEGELYTPITLVEDPGGGYPKIQSWKINFRVNYGWTFANWVKSLLGLKDWTDEMAHWTVWTLF